MHDLALLSDDELLSSIDALVLSQQRLTARLVGFLAEVEERRLHLKQACSSMFDFCTARLGMSEGEAFRRITAARLGRKFPIVLGLIESGALYLSALTLLRDHLTAENHQELLREASGKSKREVEALVARRFPKPDVAATIRKLPETRKAGRNSEPLLLGPVAPGSASQPIGNFPPEPAPTRASRARIEPLSEYRYKVQFSASAELKNKLERARNLLSHQNPSGDLATIVERALDLLLADLERKKLARTSRPRPARSAKPGAVGRASRREVFARDGLRCSFTDDQGRRCSAQGFLELDHVQARALGGSGDADNVRILCRAHNRLHAEQTFGREHVERQIHLRQRKCRQSEPEGHDTEASTTGDEYEKVFKALTRLGFRAIEARDALHQIRKVWSAATTVPTVEELLREALRLLTDRCFRVSDVAAELGVLFRAPPAHGFSSSRTRQWTSMSYRQ